MCVVHSCAHTQQITNARRVYYFASPTVFAHVRPSPPRPCPCLHQWRTSLGGKFIISQPWSFPHISNLRAARPGVSGKYHRIGCALCLTTSPFCPQLAPYLEYPFALFLRTKVRAKSRAKYDLPRTICRSSKQKLFTQGTLGLGLSYSANGSHSLHCCYSAVWSF